MDCGQHLSIYWILYSNDSRYDTIQPYLFSFSNSHLRSAICGHINMDTVSKVRICKICVQTLVSHVLHSDCLSSNSLQTDVIVGTTGLCYCDLTDLLGGKPALSNTCTWKAPNKICKGWIGLFMWTSLWGAKCWHFLKSFYLRSTQCQIKCHYEF